MNGRICRVLVLSGSLVQDAQVDVTVPTVELTTEDLPTDDDDSADVGEEIIEIATPQVHEARQTILQRVQAAEHRLLETLKDNSVPVSINTEEVDRVEARHQAVKNMNIKIAMAKASFGRLGGKVPISSPPERVPLARIARPVISRQARRVVAEILAKNSRSS